MSDLLTARQVQEILKVDRITVYRMVQDGRLNGIKIGTQWRFTQKEIDTILNGTNPFETRTDPEQQSTFPVHCMQLVQDAVAGLSEIGAVIVDEFGDPITQVSNPSPFCTLICSTQGGRLACQRSWKELVRRQENGWYICHAGLMYRSAVVMEDKKPVAYLHAGQILAEGKSLDERNLRVLAEHCGLDENQLREAARSIQVCDLAKAIQIEAWPGKITSVLEGILQERTQLIERLRRIAEISAL